MHYVYILFCGDKKLYIGYSQNLKDRIATHQSGGARATKYRQPVQLMYYECYVNAADAKAREVYLKSGGGHAQIQKQHQHELAKRGYIHLKTTTPQTHDHSGVCCVTAG